MGSRALTGAVFRALARNKNAALSARANRLLQRNIAVF